MNTILKYSAAAVVATTLFTGCTQHMGNFTAMSTDAYNPNNINKEHLVKKNVEKDVSSLTILGFPLGGYTKLDQAVSETAHSANGDFLKNAQIHYYGWSVILFGQQGYKVKADVYSTQD